MIIQPHCSDGTKKSIKVCICYELIAQQLENDEFKFALKQVSILIRLSVDFVHKAAVSATVYPNSLCLFSWKIC